MKNKCNPLMHKTWFSINTLSKKTRRQRSFKSMLLIIALIWACVLLLGYGLAFAQYSQKQDDSQNHDAPVKGTALHIETPSSAAQENRRELSTRLRELRMHNVLRDSSPVVNLQNNSLSPPVPVANTDAQ